MKEVNLSDLLSMRCDDWMLSDLLFIDGLEVVIKRWAVDGVEVEGETTTCRIHFDNPASWAFTDLSLMNQYYPESDCPPVVEILKHNHDETFVPEFTLRVEAFGNDWHHIRVNAYDDVFDVITRYMPTILS